MVIKNENISYKKRLVDWLGKFVKQGTSANDLAIIITIGFLLGIVPFFGINTMLCTFIALKWKLNLPLIIAINYIVFPLQIIFFIPFLKVTMFIFNVSDLLPSVNEIMGNLKKDWITVVTNFGYLNLLAVLVWLVLSLLTGWFIYKGVLYILRKRVTFKHL
jgi:hypothetical protein